MHTHIPVSRIVDYTYVHTYIHTVMQALPNSRAVNKKTCIHTYTYIHTPSHSSAAKSGLCGTQASPSFASGTPAEDDGSELESEPPQVCMYMCMYTYE